MGGLDVEGLLCFFPFFLVLMPEVSLIPPAFYKARNLPLCL